MTPATTRTLRTAEAILLLLAVVGPRSIRQLHATLQDWHLVSGDPATIRTHLCKLSHQQAVVRVGRARYDLGDAAPLWCALMREAMQRDTALAASWRQRLDEGGAA